MRKDEKLYAQISRKLLRNGCSPFRKLNNEILAQKKRAGQNTQEIEAKKIRFNKKLGDLKAQLQEWDKKIAAAGAKRKEFVDHKYELQAKKIKVHR